MCLPQFHYFYCSSFFFIKFILTLGVIPNE
jgi:hypothetical protein